MQGIAFQAGLKLAPEVARSLPSREIFGNKAGGFRNKAAVTVAFTKTSWQFGCSHKCFGLPPYEAFLEVASGMLLEGSSKRSGTQEIPCGNDQYPAAPEDMIQPGLCLAKVQVQGQSGRT